MKTEKLIAVVSAGVCIVLLVMAAAPPMSTYVGRFYGDGASITNVPNSGVTLAQLQASTNTATLTSQGLASQAMLASSTNTTTMVTQGLASQAMLVAGTNTTTLVSQGLASQAQLTAATNTATLVTQGLASQAQLVAATNTTTLTSQGLASQAMLVTATNSGTLGTQLASMTNSATLGTQLSSMTNSATLGTQLSSMTNSATLGTQLASMTNSPYYQTNSRFSTYQLAYNNAFLAAMAPVAALTWANTNYVMPVYIKDTWWVTNATWNISSTDSGKHYGIGLYDLGGNLLWSEVASTSANTVNHATTNFKFSPGWYYFCYTSDSTVARPQGWTVSANEMASANTTLGPMNGYFVCPPTTSGGTPPATLTLGSLTKVTNNGIGEFPWVGFQ
jgi:hypothetical protein